MCTAATAAAALGAIAGGDEQQWHAPTLMIATRDEKVRLLFLLQLLLLLTPFSSFVVPISSSHGGSDQWQLVKGVRKKREQMSANMPASE